jgi:hypothetical protein
MEEKKEPDEFSDKKDWLKSYGKYSSMVFQMILIVLIGSFGGQQLDKLLEMKHPVFTIVLILVSAGLSLFYLFNTLLKK